MGPLQALISGWSEQPLAYGLSAIARVAGRFVAIDLQSYTHGHLMGDMVLVDFSKKAKNSLRETDQLTRFGGDEFMAILPDTDLNHATLVANRFHEVGKENQPIAWSVSIGISEWLGNDDSLAALLTRADQALYKSKASGRNQTQSM